MSTQKPWVDRALDILGRSLFPVPTEPNELDWKSGLSPNKERLVEHLSAFANYPGGGFFVFGIDNSTGQAIGVSQDGVDRIVGQLTNLGRDSLEPPLVIDHAVTQWETASLLIVRISEQPMKPVHRRGKSIEHAWVRSGGSTRKASRQEIGAMMMNSRTPRWEELRSSTRLRVPDLLDQIDIAAVCKLLERPFPSDSDDALRWLVDEKMVEIDNDGGYITNFGAIAAAREIRLFDTLQRKGVRVIRYRGLNKVETIDELVGHMGYAIGFERLIAYLKQILPHSEVIREALRAEVSVYPEIALRELIANALIHQDFTIGGAGPMIEAFDDRIEFTNPGGLLPGKTIDRLIGATPESRNEVLAAAFRRYRICEERGTGFQKIVSAVELFGLPPVAFVQAENAFKVILYAPRKFAHMAQSERIEACYQHAVLKYLSSGAMTNTSLRERLKMHEKQRTQVSNQIRDAVAAGRIKRKDPDSPSSKFAEYIPYWA
ncbi:MAG: ATP-binding protein [Methylococcales bacterium]